MLTWQHQGQHHQATWHSEAGRPAPTRWQVVDDRLSADTAYRLVCEGTALLWQGDFFNARHLLDALQRRVDRPRTHKKNSAPPPPATQDDPAHIASQAFHQQRQQQARRAYLLGSVLIPIEADYRIALRRAPNVHHACSQAWGAPQAHTPAKVLALRELLGIISAYEWRKKGVSIAALQALAGNATPAPYHHIHPHYGVFSPVRGEYVDLVAQAPLPQAFETFRALGSTTATPSPLAWDIGTGTGVLAAVLARRGLKVVATDTAERALACAQDNLQRLQLGNQVQLLHTEFFPPGQADLIVCNPPWLPARAHTTLEQAIYDPDSRMLRGYLAGLKAHLRPQGQGWLILSDLAEHLGLRSRAQLHQWLEQAGLQVRDRIDTRPRHPKAMRPTDPLHAARAQEVTSLWILQAA